eukprot:85121-Hanusia_phi.AAC.9
MGSGQPSESLLVEHRTARAHEKSGKKRTPSKVFYAADLALRRLAVSGVYSSKIRNIDELSFKVALSCSRRPPLTCETAKDERECGGSVRGHQADAGDAERNRRISEAC